MATKLKELQDRRLNIATQIKDLGNKVREDGTFAPEDQAAWDKANADYDVTLAELDKVQRGEEVRSRIAQLEADDREVVRPAFLGRSQRLARENDPLAGHTNEQRSRMAVIGWFRAAAGLAVTKHQAAAMREKSVRRDAPYIDIDGWDTGQYRSCQQHWKHRHHTMAMDSYLNATMTTTGSAGADGGKSIQLETFLQRLEVNMLAVGGVRNVAEVIVTDSGNQLTWPTVNDTAQSSAIVTEGANLDASGAGGTNPTFAQVTWSAYKHSSGMALITQELLEDSAFDLGPVLGDLLGERLGRGTNTSFTTGTGSSQPTGIATSATTTGVTAASATTIAPDELIALIHSIDPAYRGSGSTGWMWNDGVTRLVRQFKDTTNQYLWQPGLQMGVPDRLLGYPIYFNQAMAVPATGVRSVVFGDLSAYKIRRVRGVRFYRLDELYRASDKTGFIAMVREDGKLLTSGTPRVKCLIQA